MPFNTFLFNIMNSFIDEQFYNENRSYIFLFIIEILFLPNRLLKAKYFVVVFVLFCFFVILLVFIKN